MPNIVNVLTHTVHAPKDGAPLCGADIPQGYGGTEKPATCKKCIRLIMLAEAEP